MMGIFNCDYRAGGKVFIFIFYYKPTILFNFLFMRRSPRRDKEVLAHLFAFRAQTETFDPSFSVSIGHAIPLSLKINYKP